MIKQLKYFLPLITLLFAACDKNEKLEPDIPTFKRISEQTQIANQFNFGFSAGDEKTIYFSHFYSGGVKLYAKNRETGSLTLLDEIIKPEIEDADMLYANLWANGDYLYYLPFDLNDEKRKNRVWRVKKDGTDKKQISQFETYDYQIYNNKLYYNVMMMDGKGFYSVNLDGTDHRKMADDDLTNFWIKDGKVYHIGYTHEGGFHAQLLVRNLEGASTSEVVFNSKLNFTYTFTDVGELYCIDISQTKCDLIRVDIATKKIEIVISDVPFGKLNTMDEAVFISFDQGNSNYKKGIYRYEKGYKMLMPVISVATNYISFIGNDQIVYANGDDKEYAGRFSQLYLTDTKGSINKKLME